MRQTGGNAITVNLFAIAKTSYVLTSSGLNREVAYKLSGTTRPINHLVELHCFDRLGNKITPDETGTYTEDPNHN
jgi:hypothetical protein